MSESEQAASINYEFSEAENHIVGRCGSRARLWGMVALGIGVVVACGTVFAFMFSGRVAILLGGLPIALVHLIVGNFYRAAGDSMAQIVTTEGYDVDHLLGSLGDLTSAHKIETLVTLISIVVSLLGVAATTGFMLG
jgi:hypothetical protein